ncbi:MAG: hypothetical protein ACR2H6_11160 [Pyrinomonadaceae bacterium]
MAKVLNSHFGQLALITLLALLLLAPSTLIEGQRRTGIPDIWDSEVSVRQRFLFPTITGLVYGVITVIKDLSSPSPFHLPLPLSIAFYAYGAVFLETLLRLFAIPFLVWLISHLILRGRLQTPVFWLAVMVAALYEPLPHIGKDLSGVTAAAVPLVLVKWIFQPLFFGKCYLRLALRKYGFLATLTLRLSFYLCGILFMAG